MIESKMVKKMKYEEFIDTIRVLSLNYDKFCTCKYKNIQHEHSCITISLRQMERELKDE